MHSAAAGSGNTVGPPVGRQLAVLLLQGGAAQLGGKVGNVLLHLQQVAVQVCGGVGMQECRTVQASDTQGPACAAAAAWHDMRSKARAVQLPHATFQASHVCTAGTLPWIH